MINLARRKPKKRKKKQPKPRLSLDELYIIQSAFNTYFDAIDYDVPNYRDKALQAVIFNLHNRATTLSAKCFDDGIRFKLSPVEVNTIYYLRNDLKIGLHDVSDAVIYKLLEINN
jgi:hypothetical protein